MEEGSTGGKKEVEEESGGNRMERAPNQKIYRLRYKWKTFLLFQVSSIEII